MECKDHQQVQRIPNHTSNLQVLNFEREKMNSPSIGLHLTPPGSSLDHPRTQRTLHSLPDHMCREYTRRPPSSNSRRGLQKMLGTESPFPQNKMRWKRTPSMAPQGGQRAHYYSYSLPQASFQTRLLYLLDTQSSVNRLHKSDFPGILHKLLLDPQRIPFRRDSR